jgi:anaphase-promoting complex subunit 3
MDEDIQSPRSPSNSIAPRSPRSDISTAPRQEDADIEAADAYVLELVRIFARAVRALARYECHSVIDELERLPVEQQRSPWVLTMIGRAEYEMLEYVKVSGRIMGTFSFLQLC